MNTADRVTMPEPLPTFQATQYAFAGALRRQQMGSALHDVPAERMDLYRELIYHNLERFIAGGFPVLHALLDGASWQDLIKDFLLRHSSRTPYFCGIPEEFLDYLQNERGERDGDPPFLLELAHYEWVELALAVEESNPPPENALLFAAPLESRPVVASTAWPLAYRYPVHKIGRDDRPDAPPETVTYLAVYRDRGDRVRFLELNAVTHRLLCMIREDPGQAARSYLDRLGAELGYPDTGALHAHGAELLSDLAQRAVIGTL